MLKLLLCTCDLQAFTSSVQYSKRNQLVFRCSKTFRCRNCRYVLKLGYIMHGRDLVKKVKKNCERCRYLRNKAINIEMGPASSHSLRIAPAFYATQVDLCGPFKAYSPHNKRTTIKIWLAIYCCMSTSTTLIKAMEDYSTTAIQPLFDSLVRLAIQSFYQ